MEARKVAAQFAAYVWFEATQRAERSEKEKARFARKNWRPFVPVAPEGLGRLLLKIAGGRSSRQPNSKTGSRKCPRRIRPWMPHVSEGSETLLASNGMPTGVS